VVQWVVSGVALIVAALAWVRSRTLNRKQDQLTQQYWELRYQHGQLKARVDRLDPDTQAAAEPPAAGPGQTFIPLSSLKR
jgi:hypothetical protein